MSSAGQQAQQVLEEVRRMPEMTDEEIEDARVRAEHIVITNGLNAQSSVNLLRLICKLRKCQETTEPLKDPVECDDCGAKLEREDAHLFRSEGQDDCYICGECYRTCLERGGDTEETLED